MIGRLRGIILEKQPPLVLLETGGVGYEVHMPMTCFYELPEAGQEAIIFTHFVVREDAQLLYGFNNKQERTLFKELIKTNGVGPKLALAILSGMSAQQFVNAVEREELGALVKLPGKMCIRDRRWPPCSPRSRSYLRSRGFAALPPCCNLNYFGETVLRQSITVYVQSIPRAVGRGSLPPSCCGRSGQGSRPAIRLSSIRCDVVLR